MQRDCTVHGNEHSMRRLLEGGKGTLSKRSKTVYDLRAIKRCDGWHVYSYLPHV